MTLRVRAVQLPRGAAHCRMPHRLLSSPVLSRPVLSSPVMSRPSPESPALGSPHATPSARAATTLPGMSQDQGSEGAARRRLPCPRPRRRSLPRAPIARSSTRSAARAARLTGRCPVAGSRLERARDRPARLRIDAGVDRMSPQAGPPPLSSSPAPCAPAARCASRRSRAPSGPRSTAVSRRVRRGAATRQEPQARPRSGRRSRRCGRSSAVESAPARPEHPSLLSWCSESDRSEAGGSETGSSGTGRSETSRSAARGVPTNRSGAPSLPTQPFPRPESVRATQVGRPSRPSLRRPSLRWSSPL